MYIFRSNSESSIKKKLSYPSLKEKDMEKIDSKEMEEPLAKSETNLLKNEKQKINFVDFIENEYPKNINNFQKYSPKNKIEDAEIIINYSQKNIINIDDESYVVDSEDISNNTLDHDHFTVREENINRYINNKMFEKNIDKESNEIPLGKIIENKDLDIENMYSKDKKFNEESNAVIFHKFSENTSSDSPLSSSDSSMNEYEKKDMKLNLELGIRTHDIEEKHKDYEIQELKEELIKKSANINALMIKNLFLYTIFDKYKKNMNEKLYNLNNVKKELEKEIDQKNEFIVGFRNENHQLKKIIENFKYGAYIFIPLFCSSLFYNIIY